MLKSTMSFLVVLGFLMALVSTITTDQTNNGYKALNRLLKQQTLAEDVQANLEVAKQQLKVLKDNYQPEMGELYSHGDNEEKQLIEAIEEFIEAIEIFTKDNFDCGQTEQAVLAPLATHTEGFKYYTESEQLDLDRLDSIANRVLSNYAKQCMPQYPAKFETKINEVDKESKKIVDDFMGDLLIREPSLSPKECMKWLATREPFDLENDAEHIAAHIKAASSNDPEKGFIVYIYHKYFFEPCQNYIWALGPDLFEPAMFGAHMYENLEAAYNNLEGATLLDYFKSMASYNFCRATIHDNQFETRVRSLLEDVKKSD